MIKILNLNKFELNLNNDKTLVANNQDLGFINFRFYKYNKLLLYGNKVCKFSLLSNTLTELVSDAFFTCICLYNIFTCIFTCVAN